MENTNITPPAPAPQCPPVPVNDLIRTDREFEDDVIAAAHWGFTQGLAAAQRLADEERQRGADAWPEPITDRVPTEADGDVDGRVQCQYPNGLWGDCSWLTAKDDKRAWHHTPRWRPKPPTKREQALAALRRLRERATNESGSVWMAPTELAAITQALEEAGDER